MLAQIPFKVGTVFRHRWCFSNPLYLQLPTNHLLVVQHRSVSSLIVELFHGCLAVMEDCPFHKGSLDSVQILFQMVLRCNFRFMHVKWDIIFLCNYLSFVVYNNFLFIW